MSMIALHQAVMKQYQHDNITYYMYKYIRAVPFEILRGRLNGKKIVNLPPRYFFPFCPLQISNGMSLKPFLSFLSGNDRYIHWESTYTLRIVLKPGWGHYWCLITQILGKLWNRYYWIIAHIWTFIPIMHYGASSPEILHYLEK